MKQSPKNLKTLSKARNENIYQTILNIFFTILSASIVIPFLILVSVSLSSEASIVKYGYQLIPKEFSLEAYEYVFDNPKMILDGYKTTITYSTIGTFFSVLLIAMCAYPLSRPRLIGRYQISFYLYFTMLFNGGLVPSYILNTRYLGLGDSIWIYIIPSLISVWYVFMMRTFFQGLPNEIFESMQIDGASEYNIFFKTVLPLSKPVLATVALMTFLGKWNDWYTAKIYINTQELYSLQYILQNILNNIKVMQEMATMGGGIVLDVSSIPGETSRMAMAIVVAGPALVIFPFFQKYFVKGLTVGSVKG